MLVFAVGHIQAVRITKFEVPEWFEIRDDDSIDNKLELDCAYEIEPNEKGITLQWYFNDTLIYQWLPEEQLPPHTFVSIIYLCIFILPLTCLYYYLYWIWIMDQLQTKTICFWSFDT